MHFICVQPMHNQYNVCYFVLVQTVCSIHVFALYVVAEFVLTSTMQPYIHDLE